MATGFSPDGQCIAYLPGLSLDASNLPRLWSIPASVGAAAHSLLLNAATGQAVAHWVELDHSADSVEPPEGYPRATLLWAAGRLNDSTRYIVAYRNLVDDMGIPVQAGDAFAALRDKIPTSNADVEASRPRYEAIFTTLAQFGFARANLTLAWDFTTASLVDITGRMVCRAAARPRRCRDDSIDLYIAALVRYYWVFIFSFSCLRCRYTCETTHFHESRAEPAYRMLLTRSRRTRAKASRDRFKDPSASLSI